jgi:sec-independent protein translocase protein TatB
MLDMSWGEVMLIGGVALIVIGPKELPRALRTVGQTMAKVRRMASEFQGQFSDAMREADLEDVRKDLDGLNREVSAATSTAFNPIQTIRDELKGAVDRPVVPPSAPLPAAEMPVLPPDFTTSQPFPVDEIAPPAPLPPAPLPSAPEPVPPRVADVQDNTPAEPGAPRPLAAEPGAPRPLASTATP